MSSSAAFHTDRFAFSFLLEKGLKLKLVLHGTFRQTNSATLSDDITSDSCEGFPLFFLPLLPMMVPKEFVRQENWKYVNIYRDVAATLY